ncbi:MAG: hypothetical protein ACLPSF_08055 [Methylocella sp.]
MLRLGSILGFALGLAIMFAAYMGTQDRSVAEPQAADAGCIAQKVALDEGYGVTRTETHVVCAKGAADKSQDRRD